MYAYYKNADTYVISEFKPGALMKNKRPHRISLTAKEFRLITINEILIQWFFKDVIPTLKSGDKDVVIMLQAEETA